MAVRGARVYDIAFKLSAQFGQGFSETFADAENIAQSLGNRMIDVGDAMTFAITRPLTRLGSQAIDTGAEFEKNIANIRGIDNMAIEEVDRLADGIRDLASDGVFGLNILSTAAKNFVTRGSDAEGTLYKLEHAMTLSAATGQDLYTTTEFLNSMMNKLGGDSELVAQAVDSFALASGLAHRPLSALIGSWNYMGSAVRDANMSMDQANAALVVMADNNYSGTQAGTMFARMMQDLLTPTAGAADALAALDFSMFDDDGNVRDFNEAMRDLSERLDGLETDYERVNMLNDIFTVNGARAANIILNNVDKLDDYTEAIYAAGDAFGGIGQAAGMADIRQDTFQSSVNQIQNQFELLGDSVYTILQPRLAGVADRVQSIITWFSNLDDSTQETIVNIGLFAAAIGPALVVMGTLIKNGALVIGAVGGMAKAFIAFQVAAGPIGWILTGLAVAVGVGAAVWRGFENAHERARLALIHSGEVLNESRTQAENAVEAHSRVESLVDTYHSLTQAINAGALSTQEFVAAERELASVRRELEELASARVHYTHLENMSMGELIETVGHLTEMEKELAVARLALELSQVNIGNLEVEKQRLEESRDSLARRAIAYAELMTAINMAALEIETLGGLWTDIPWEEQNRILSNVSELAGDLGHTINNDLNMGYSMMMMLMGELAPAFEEVNSEINQTNDEIIAATNSVNEHHRSAKALARMTGQAVFVNKKV